MIINKKFDYKPLERVESPEGRRYIVGEGRALPSVTTILSKTKDMTHLNAWKKKVGEEQAEKIKVEASTLGSGMHKNLERHILGESLTGSYMAQTLAKVIINNGLTNIEEVWGSEVSLYSKDLYAGSTDLIGIHNGEPAIIDFKNSLREKKKEWIDDYRAQIAAYALAHNEMFGTDIKRGVIMIATRDAKYQEFVFEGKEFDQCISIWLTSLEKYYKLYSNDK
jgi:genome maintenance exonuclease 1